jgi:magnesium chelatase family protein
MPSRVYSATVVGVDAFEVEVEVEVHTGYGDHGKVAVVGLPDTAVRESKDRVLSAITNSALRRPRGKITVHLAPATVRKEGPSFDLPIAIGMLKINDDNRIPDLSPYCLAGELALSGELRPVRGVPASALEAKKRGRQMLIVPKLNAEEAAPVQGLAAYGGNSLTEVVNFLRGEAPLEPVAGQPAFTAGKIDDDFAEVHGQQHNGVAVSVLMNIFLHPIPDLGDEYFAAHLTSHLAREPVAVGWSIPRVIADAAVKLGRDRIELFVERITAEQYQTLSRFLSSQSS